MSISKCRKVITFAGFPPPYKLLLECLSTEKRSYVREYITLQNKTFLPSFTASSHSNGNPKALHITIPGEGLFEIGNQAYLAGDYCFYYDLAKKLRYSKISKDELNYIILNRNNLSYRDCLLALNKPYVI
ncbi:TPA: hypothetical protein N6Q93_003582 [Escherichia coli]|uniref:hypothetical protein n=2 Tax=Escherichia coli TaxID=562 RepID=UPI000944C03D|nr:hypothetical protein [Escherichia coli]EFJ1775378.1 hypothetical protein [Escherichia coli]EFN5698851.1 hypothetical protein [Escherichia coli]EGI4628666.1 hypothetical protein [Escherichia coli]EHL9099816.1 hypothetical protein [Escherichia coli]EIL3948903.1 hypothetical protein [Escherichia coli]